VIHDQIIDALVANLTETLITNIPESDSSRAGLVQSGALQDDPQRYRISVMVHPNDRDNPGKWRDELLSSPRKEFRERLLPKFFAEVGGTIGWIRRFTIEIQCFYTKTGEEKEEARNDTYKVLSRIMATIQDRPLRISDEMGETVIMGLVRWSWVREGGGPPRSYIWRGKVGVEYYTFR